MSKPVLLDLRGIRAKFANCPICSGLIGHGRIGAKSIEGTSGEELLFQAFVGTGGVRRDRTCPHCSQRFSGITISGVVTMHASRHVRSMLIRPEAPWYRRERTEKEKDEYHKMICKKS